MKDQWYADKRDLVKWAALFALAGDSAINNIVQIAYYTPSKFNKISIDGKERDILPEIISHFRNIHNTKNINSRINVIVYDKPFKHDTRATFHKELIGFLKKNKQKSIIFLDPDTGLAPKQPKDTHVKLNEVTLIWKELKQGDVLVFYQHRFRKKGWDQDKREQLSGAIRVPINSIKIAKGQQIVNDVVFYYIQK